MANQQDDKKMQEVRATVQALQDQISRRSQEIAQLKQELEAAQEAKQNIATTQRNRLREMRQEMADMRKKLEQAEQDARNQPDIDTARAQVVELEKQVGEAETIGSTELKVGGNAWVRRAGGQGLNRRDAPGLNSNVLDSFAIGTQLALLEGPTPADNYTWWRVRASDDREGWVAGEELVTQPE
jgi:seryl-tRNA synthetase